MNDTGYIVGFICMAVAIAALLAFGALTMARMNARQQEAAEKEAAHPPREPGDERHHWYDRFHHAA